MQERRDFLKHLAILTAGLLWPINGKSSDTSDKWSQVLPLRKLGRTDEYVTMLGLGGYHVGWTSEKDAREVIETAINGGIRFFDTAESYSNGLSETRYGKYLVPNYRDQVFIMTKSTAANGELAQKHLEESLKRLNCDVIDLWQVHALGTPEDVDNRIRNEVLDVFERAKAQGKVKHLGFTGHQNPFAHLRMFEQTESKELFETVQMPINAIDSFFHSFIKNVMPVALERQFGVLAMKSLADGRFFKEKKMNDKLIWQTDQPITPDYLTVRDALFFVWSLPVSVLITGAENKVLLEEKIELARQFSELSEQERLAIMDKVVHLAGNNVEYYKKV